MNLKDIDIEILIIIPIAIILLLIVVSGIQALANISQVYKIRQFIVIENLETIKTTKAYYTALGLKKGYPSYPSVFNLSANSEEIFVYGYSQFPFIFKTYYPPFVLSVNRNRTKKKLEINRIFELENIKIKDKRHLNIQFVDTNVISTSIDYQIDFRNHLPEMTLKNLKAIEDKIKTNANKGRKLNK